MKKIAVIGIFLMLGCATSSSITQEAANDPNTVVDGNLISDIVREAKTDPDSFERCMRYDEVITLTPKEEFALFEHCMKKFD